MAPAKRSQASAELTAGRTSKRRKAAEASTAKVREIAEAEQDDPVSGDAEFDDIVVEVVAKPLGRGIKRKSVAATSSASPTVDSPSPAEALTGQIAKVARLQLIVSAT